MGGVRPSTAETEDNDEFALLEPTLEGYEVLCPSMETNSEAVVMAIGCVFNPLD